MGFTDPHLEDQGPHFELGRGGGQGYLGPGPGQDPRGPQGSDLTFGCVWPAIRKPSGCFIHNDDNSCPDIFAQAMDSSITLHA